MENYGIFLRKIIQIVAKGDTFILNFQFSIINYLSSKLLDKLEFVHLTGNGFDGMMYIHAPAWWNR